MARFSRAHGGFFTERDLGEQRARWGEPVSTNYRGVTIYETPPPTQGLSVLQMLNLIEPVDLARLDRLGPDAVHLLVQAKQIAFHDRDRHIADPDFFKVPVERLLSKVYADERLPLLDPHRALPWDRVPSYGSLAGDTVAVCAVDARQRRLVIHSVYGVYGGVVADAPESCSRTGAPTSALIPRIRTASSREDSLHPRSPRSPSGRL
jgi:gamma-glutamyltranspeptidase/glutathione hydrolase